VIGSASGYPITREFLQTMKSYWFGPPVHPSEPSKSAGSVNSPICMTTYPGRDLSGPLSYWNVKADGFHICSADTNELRDCDGALITRFGLKGRGSILDDDTGVRSINHALINVLPSPVFSRTNRLSLIWNHRTGRPSVVR
jgi:hypothetical protein